MGRITKKYVFRSKEREGYKFFEVNKGWKLLSEIDDRNKIVLYTKREANGILSTMVDCGYPHILEIILFENI